MSNLSDRGHAASLPHPSTVIWDVLDDLWDPQSNPSGYVSLGVAENALMHNELAAYINSIPSKNPLPTTAFTYGDGPTGSKKCKLALSHFLNEGLKPTVPITPSHLVLTSGVTASIEHCSWAFCNPGESILLGQPHYGAFIGDMSIRPNVSVIPVPFDSTDPIGASCISAYESAILNASAKGVKPRALMLCNPHNPLGRCYSRTTLIDLMNLCARHSLHLISDKIYAFSTWTNNTLPPSDPQPTPFTSILTIPPNTTPLPPSQIHLLWGLSKDFNANGLRLGCILSQANPPFLSAIRTVALQSAPSSLVEHVTTVMLSDTAFTEQYLRTNQQRLSESYTFITTWAKNYGIPYAEGANAAFFLWCDFGAVWKPRPLQSQAQSQSHSKPEGQTTTTPSSTTTTLTRQINSRLLAHKIFLASGEVFGSEKEGYFRIVFSQPRAYLEEGLRRIAVALELEKEEEEMEGTM